MLTGLLILLAGQKEALEVASDMDSSLAPLKVQYAAVLNDWASFRHDAAHAAERIFRQLPNRNNVNDPQTRSGDTVVIAYDWKTEIVRTGDGRMMNVPDALRASQEIIEAAKPLVGL
ncbi:MAG TPA: hypothetical protein VKT72_13050 [Candidatus Baltobacteraceae bacterium]|nr:hypothetical protein [Candidatus Baltobacteraceae bacterium]